MNAFLPAGYCFSPNKLLNDFLKYNIFHPVSSVRIWEYWIFAIVCLLLSIGITIHISNKKVHLDKISKVSWYIFLVVMSSVLFVGTGYYFASTAINSDPHLYYSFYTNSAFKCADKGNLSVRMLDNNPHPIKIDDHKPYPYKLHYDDDDEGDEYLGTMKNGKFTPSTDGLGPTFYKYCQYIQQHKLADKFKHDATLKRDGRYQTRDGKAQWVLTNNKDVILHLVDNTSVGQAHVVEN